MFCENYINSTNIAQAAKLAGVKQRYAENLIKEPKIKQYIEELDARAKNFSKVSANMIVDELKEIAFFDVSEMIKYEDGKFVLKSEEGLKKYGRMIKKIRYNDKTKQTEVEFYDKLSALDMLAKHVGFYERDNEQKKQEVIQFYLPVNNRDKVIDIEEFGEDEPLTKNIGQTSGPAIKLSDE